MATSTKTARKRGGASKPRAKKSAPKASATTKTAAKPKADKSRPTHKQRLAMTPAQLAKLGLRKVTVKSLDGKSKRTVLRPTAIRESVGSGARESSFAAATDYVTRLICTDSNGVAIGRGPMSTTRVALVSAFLKKTRKTAAATVHAIVGEKSQAKSIETATAYADGQIGRTDLPDGMADRLAEFVERFSKSVGKSPAKHKLSGKSMAAVLVALDKHPVK